MPARGSCPSRGRCLILRVLARRPPEELTLSVRHSSGFSVPPAFSTLAMPTVTSLHLSTDGTLPCIAHPDLYSTVRHVAFRPSLSADFYSCSPNRRTTRHPYFHLLPLPYDPPPRRLGRRHRRPRPRVHPLGTPHRHLPHPLRPLRLPPIHEIVKIRLTNSKGHPEGDDLEGRFWREDHEATEWSSKVMRYW